MLENIKLINKAVFIEDEEILVIGDLHLGFEDSLSAVGVFLPRFQLKQTIQDLEKIFKKIGEVKEILLLGDVKDAFGMVAKQEWKDVTKIIEFLEKKCKKITFIRGNHDNILEPIIKRKGYALNDFYKLNGYFFMHGDKNVKEVESSEVKWIFMGHQHPAIVLGKGMRKESYKCYLIGEWRGKKIVVLPSFFPLVEGYDVRHEAVFLALTLNLKKFIVYVVGDDDIIRDMGRLGDLYE